MTHAEQLNQYVTELEEYVAKHGHLPAASRSTPSTNKQRLKYALDSPRTDEAIKGRITALLEAPRYGGRRNMVEHARQVRDTETARILAYLEPLESHLREHGHLRVGPAPTGPWVDKGRLRRYLAKPFLDEPTRERINALLAAPGRARNTMRPGPEAFDGLAAAAAELARPVSGARKEMLDWIIAHQKLPSPVSGDLGELGYYRLLGQIRRSVVKGQATLSTTEFSLLIPGMMTPSELERATAHASAKRALAAEYESRKNRLGSLEDRWDRGFEELTAWVEAHGTLPRRRTFDAEEYRVANWLNVQRMQLRDNNLRPEWRERLAAVPEALEPRKQLRGEAELAKTVADFYERNGRLPRADVPAPEGTVGLRLQKLRTRIRKGDIGRDALQILSSLPGATEFVDRKPPLERLADLEEFVRTTGTFPALNTDGLSNWAYRALNGQGSKRAPEAAELRRAVRKLRESVPYKVTRRKKQGLAEYVAELEAYLAEHGHLPTSTKWASPQFKVTNLRRSLESEQTDDVLRARIRRVLAAPPYDRGRSAA